MEEENVNHPELVITRFFDVPQEKAWKAWTDPEEVKRWWGTRDYSCPSAAIDLRVGGQYIHCMRGALTPGGTEKDFWRGGEFLEIVLMERSVSWANFAETEDEIIPSQYFGVNAYWPFEIKSISVFESAGPDKTKFILHYPDVSGISPKGLAYMQKAWNQVLDRLAKALE